MIARPNQATNHNHYPSYQRQQHNCRHQANRHLHNRGPEPEQKAERCRHNKNYQRRGTNTHIYRLKIVLQQFDHFQDLAIHQIGIGFIFSFLKQKRLRHGPALRQGAVAKTSSPWRGSHLERRRTPQRPLRRSRLSYRNPRQSKSHCGSRPRKTSTVKLLGGPHSTSSAVASSTNSFDF